MSNFSSAILSASVINGLTLQSVLDSSLPVRYTSSYQSGVISNTGTTHTALESPGLSVTSVLADEALVFIFTSGVSAGTIGGIVGMQSTYNSTDVTNYGYFYGAAAATGGDYGAITTVTVVTGVSGTVSLYTKMWRHGGTGTVYAGPRTYHCFQFKIRA